MNSRLMIKIGGRAFEDRTGYRQLADAILVRGDTQVIIVHGGGREISKALADAGRPTVFVDGIRVTQAEDIEIVEAVLSETVNRRIAEHLEDYGVRCRRMSGKTDQMLVVEPLKRGTQAFGFVGQIEQINPQVILTALEKGEVPVISPISADDTGQSYNVNADTAASALAVAVGCTDLVYLTDVPGVCIGEETKYCLTIQEARNLIADGAIAGGMVAKMESAFEAIKGHVSRVHVTSWEGAKTIDCLLDRSADRGTVIEE